MSARHPAAPGEDATLIGPRLRALRDAPVEGMSRRTLLRRSLGLGVGLLLAEGTAGSIAFLWNAAGGDRAKVPIGTLDDLIASNPGIPIRDGFPLHVPQAQPFVVVFAPRVAPFLPAAHARAAAALTP